MCDVYVFGFSLLQEPLSLLRYHDSYPNLNENIPATVCLDVYDMLKSQELSVLLSPSFLKNSATMPSDHRNIFGLARGPSPFFWLSCDIFVTVFKQGFCFFFFFCQPEKPCTCLGTSSAALSTSCLSTHTGKVSLEHNIEGNVVRQPRRALQRQEKPSAQGSFPWNIKATDTYFYQPGRGPQKPLHGVWVSYSFSHPRTPSPTLAKSLH